MLDGMRGGTTASTILALGGWVVAIFALHFSLFIPILFYCAAAKREFGLYNILGMGAPPPGAHRDMGNDFFVAIGTTAAGLLCGIAFSSWRSWA